MEKHVILFYLLFAVELNKIKNSYQNEEIEKKNKKQFIFWPVETEFERS